MTVDEVVDRYLAGVLSGMAQKDEWDRITAAVKRITRPKLAAELYKRGVDIDGISGMLDVLPFVAKRYLQIAGVIPRVYQPRATVEVKDISPEQGAWELRHRIALARDAGATVGEIARALGKSTARIRQMERKARLETERGFRSPLEKIIDPGQQFTRPNR